MLTAWLSRICEHLPLQLYSLVQLLLTFLLSFLPFFKCKLLYLLEYFFIRKLTYLFKCANIFINMITALASTSQIESDLSWSYFFPDVLLFSVYSFEDHKVFPEYTYDAVYISPYLSPSSTRRIEHYYKVSMAKQKRHPIYRLFKRITIFMLKSQNEDVSYNQMASQHYLLQVVHKITVFTFCVILDLIKCGSTKKNVNGATRCLVI